MGWLTSMLILTSFNYISTSSAATRSDIVSEVLPIGSQLDDINDMTDNNLPVIDPQEDFALRKIGHYLAEILVHDWPSNDLPVVYVEEQDEEEYPDEQSLFNKDDNSQEAVEVPLKRTRYYRKYPWKRQNSRNPYEAENRYMCQPSKDDVFRLLVALHETRQGNRGRTINFCNRKRPASSIFTNIRFLGRRK